MNLLRITLTLVLFTALTSFKTVDSFLPTSLKITVLDSTGNPAENVSITLYTSKGDYQKEENPVSETLKTNEKGQVKFKNLKPITYFILAEKEGQSNIGSGVQTNPLLEGRTNKVNTIIE